MAQALDSDPYIPMSRIQQYLVLSTIGNIISPTASVNGHPAYTIPQVVPLIAYNILTQFDISQLTYLTRSHNAVLARLKPMMSLSCSSFSTASNSITNVTSVTEEKNHHARKSIHGDSLCRVLRTLAA